MKSLVTLEAVAYLIIAAGFLLATIIKTVL